MRYLLAFLISVMTATLCTPAAAQFEFKTDSDSAPQFSSSVKCAKCHQDIFGYWKESLHAQAINDPIFQAAFMVAIKEQGDEVRHVCLGCHVPTTAVTGDVMIEEEISKEAITCDFCHRISNVAYEGGVSTVTLTSGKEKHGPLKLDGKNKPHPIVQSDLFTDSRICATCHQWTNEHGVVIFDTYEEWLKSSYAKKGVGCQNCHMPLVEGSIVRGKDQEYKGKINSHNLAGGHSIVQVASSATVRVASVEQVPGGLHAVVEVSNTGSGHMIPTGLPSRALVLEVQLLDSTGSVVETATQEFRKIVVDENLAEITRDADIILNGRAISKDNRIAPGATVRVPFDFAASSKEKYLIRATLSYRYSPLILKAEEINIEMGSDAMSP